MRCWLPLFIVITLWGNGCKSFHSTYSEEPADWREWQARRTESIAGTNGWTTLVARYWLSEGQTFAGSDPTSQLVLPEKHAPARIGVFTRTGKTVRFEAEPGVVATVDGLPIRRVDLRTDIDNQPSRLVVGSLSFVIIERGDRLGVRVRDPESPARLGFKGLRYFPYDASWRIAGHFDPYSPTRTLRVPDVIGGIQEFPSPGAVVFSRAGVEHRLDVVEEKGADQYFVIFKDQTAGKSTYAAGRFLYVSKPDASGRVVIDFNRAYTPPCGFTPFATCPMPPRQNWLPIAIKAGERRPADSH